MYCFILALFILAMKRVRLDIYNTPRNAFKLPSICIFPVLMLFPVVFTSFLEFLFEFLVHMFVSVSTIESY